MSKKITLCTLTLIFTMASLTYISFAKDNSNLPDGWFKSGASPNDYDMQIDNTMYHTGSSSGLIASNTARPNRFGTLMQICRADNYLGKRVRMTGHIKTENVTSWAGMWMRVDGPRKGSLSFDNMSDRPIKGSTDWTAYQIVLDVPESSANLAFGILLEGTGRAWIDDISFEIVGKAEPTTDIQDLGHYPKKPIALNFEKN